MATPDGAVPLEGSIVPWPTDRGPVPSVVVDTPLRLGTVNGSDVGGGKAIFIANGSRSPRAVCTNAAPCLVPATYAPVASTATPLALSLTPFPNWMAGD